LSPGTVTTRLAALRFFYTKTLKKAWNIAETPYSKKTPSDPQPFSIEKKLHNSPMPLARGEARDDC
jgi:hypothetical protein